MNDLTPAELAELRRLSDAGTPEPWEHDLDCDDPEGTISGVHNCAVAMVFPFANVNTIDRHGGQTFSHRDARLIPASRNALPRLLDEIERLRALLSQRGG